MAGCSYFSPKYQISFDPGQVNPNELKKFEEVRDTLKKSYYQKVDENTLVEGAISGMADSLQDPYTVYFNKEQMKAFMERSDGSYVGIGITVLMDANGLSFLLL
jgi:carboxyl-terminal processing protease